MSFRKAEKIGIRARIGLCGPTGSGKTWWALEVATRFAKQYGSRIAFIDSERGSAKKYADKFDFDVLELATFEPEKYIDAIHDAAKAGYQVVVIDSLSHAWEGQGGVLERVDSVAKKQTRPNSYTAWREGTKVQNDLVNAMLEFPGHIIVTMRTKMAYEQTKDDNGKSKVTKVGLQPVQRDGLEYEFDIVTDINAEHEMMVSKTRCSEIADKVYRKHEADKFCATVIIWLGDQTTVEDKQPAVVNKASERYKLENRVRAGEMNVYKGVEKAINAARVKYLKDVDGNPIDVTNKHADPLEDATEESLSGYLGHMIEKAKANKEAAA